MRVCLIVPGFSASASDWCIPALLDLVRWLSDRHDLWVLSLRYPQRSESYRVFSARVRALGAAGGTGPRRALLLARALAAVAAEHRRRPFDVVHGLWADEAGWLATACGRLLGRPALVSVMGGELVGLAEISYGVQLGCTGRLLVRRSLRGARLVTAGSTSIAAAAVAVAGEKVRRLPLGVEPRRFSADGEAAPLAGDPRLLAVGSLSPVKDRDTLLAAFTLVAGKLPGARLHLVGDGALRRHLEKVAASPSVAGRVVFHGAVPHHLLPPLYRAADLHLVSSRFESQGMAALEAAACGTPTLGTAVGILPDLGEAARTVAVGDASGMADEALALLADRPRLARLGRAARAVVTRDLTLGACGSRLEKLYEELVAAAAGGGP